MTYLNPNPFTARREIAQVKLDSINKAIDFADRNDIPGTYVTGSSGVSAARHRRLERQIERRVKLAVQQAEAQRELNRLESLERAYTLGKVDADGRPVRAEKPAKKKRQTSKRAKLKRQLIDALWIDGVATTPNGYTLSNFQHWCEDRKDLIGLVRVQQPSGRFTEFETDTPQGVGFLRLNGLLLDVILDITEL